MLQLKDLNPAIAHVDLDRFEDHFGPVACLPMP